MSDGWYFYYFVANILNKNDKNGGYESPIIP